MRMDDHRQRSPRGPAPITLIVSLLLLLGVGGGVLYMYRSGVKPGDAASRSLGKPLGDVRGPAPPGASAGDSASGLSISRDDPGAGSSVPTLAPSPEDPLPPPTSVAPSAVPVTPPAGPTQPSPGAALAVPAPSSTSASSISPPPPPPRDAAGSAHRTAPQTADRPQSIDQLLEGQTAGEKTKVDKIRAERIKADKARVAMPDLGAKDAAGPVLIQIGAFSSGRLADQEWSRAAALAPGPMAGKGKRVVPVTKDGETLYRTSITGFSSRDQAVELCDRLKAAGGHCFVH